MERFIIIDFSRSNCAHFFNVSATLSPIQIVFFSKCCVWNRLHTSLRYHAELSESTWLPWLHTVAIHLDVLKTLHRFTTSYLNEPYTQIPSTCPFQNTFWFTVGWCVFFYVPSIIFAVKLAKYYRIMDEEAPYRAPKKSKKKKKQERRESDEEMPMDDMDHGTGTCHQIPPSLFIFQACGLCFCTFLSQ